MLRQLIKDGLLLSVVLLLAVTSVFAQRKSEKLSRGVIAINQGNGQVYVSWRLLGTDPANISFNLYRSSDGNQAVKLNSTLITSTTDFTDKGVNTGVSNEYYIKPVINGIEQTACKSFILAANAPVQQYQRIAVQPIDGKYNYNMKFCWVGDLNGDGDYDYVIDRLPSPSNPDAFGGRTPKIEGYLNDGTFKWRVDVGPNVEISTGHNDHVTVFDLDSDGKAEIVLKTSEGTVFGDGTVIPDVNGDGIIDYRNASGNVYGHAPQYISVINGNTGAEMARATIPHQDDDSPTPGKKHWEIGAFLGHFGIMYMDGIHPSFLFQYTNRNNAGPCDKGFNQFITTWDYRNGTLTQRTDWNDECGANSGGDCYSHFHQIRVVDVDRDGKDEMVEGGFVLDDNGKPLWGNCEIVHGDRHQTSDLDPDRPGLETFLIQQNNPSSLGMALIEAATGKFIKKWYMGAQGDVGRGEAVDIDPNHKGVELVSTMGGLYSAKGDFLGEKNIFPNSGIWWDGDLQREMLRAPDGSGANIHVNKPGLFNGVYGEGPRLIEFAKQSGWLVNADYGCRPMFEGDILGDWREEVVLREHNPENTGYVAFRIYTTTVPAETRLYCLMQNPAYRQTVTTKGYYQAPYTDYYLGVGMSTPPMPPIQETKLSWKGGQASNAWDINTTSNWVDNSGSPVVFNQNDDVMLDIRGTGNSIITLSGTITPASVLINSPIDYTFNGTGSLSGTMSLTKAGAGSLIYNTSNDYTGTTTIDEGALVVNSTLSQSPVSVSWHAGLGGTGILSQQVTFAPGAIIMPGTEGVAGVLTFSKDVTLSGEMALKFDLSDEPSGVTKKHDKIQINGNLTLTGINTIQVNQLNGNLPAGTYDLICYTGTFTGDIANLKISGIVGKKYHVNNAAGVISVTIEEPRGAGKVTWAGAGANWDILTSPNWLLNGVSDIFAPNDSVVFDATGSAQNSITITEGSMPVKDMRVETATTSYKFSGTGMISGTGDLTKNGLGLLSLLNKNDFTGKTIVNGGTLEVGYLDDAGIPSAIGATTSLDPSYFVMNNASLKYTGPSDIYTNRGITLNGTADTIEMVPPKMLTLKGLITGPGKLVKTGQGTITLQQQNNTFTGGVVLKQGNINLGDDQANRYGLGPENATITLEGGILSMFSSGSYTDVYWNMIVPEGATARLNADYRATINGTLTGAGTLNMYIPYVRSDFYGNWSGFTGKLNIYFKSEGKGTTSGHFRIFNNHGYASASIHLGSKEVTAYPNMRRTIAIGELSGVKGSSVSDADWVIGSKNTDATFAGKINSHSITKVGTGAWILTDTSAYTGTTTVNGGKLLVNYPGIIKGTGAVTVNSGAIIGGSGTLSGILTIASGGIVAPGNNAIGTLNINNSVSSSSGSTTEMEIDKTSNACDQIVSAGTITLNGTLKIVQLDNKPLSQGDNFKLFNATSITGKFSAIDPVIPGTGLVWDTSALRSTGIIFVKVPQTISFTLPSDKKYGDEPFDISATGGASDNPVTFSIVSGDAVTLSGNTVTIVKAGSVKIKASQEGNTNYLTADDVFQMLTIEKRVQTIAFTLPSDKKYGNEPFDISATGGASDNPVTYSVVSGDAVSISGKTVTIVKAGTVLIQAAQAGNDNYLAASPVEQSLTINKAQLTVKAADTTKVAGKTNPEFKLIYTGFVNNENSGNLDVVPTVTCEATDASPSGNYVITVSAGNDKNYNITTVNGTLTVTPVTSANSLVAQSVKVYPNPVNDKLVVVVQGFIKVCYFEVLNSNGAKINTIEPMGDSNELYFGGYASGIYTLKIVTEKGVITKSILKR